jgi:hypothetical protein
MHLWPVRRHRLARFIRLLHPHGAPLKGNDVSYRSDRHTVSQVNATVPATTSISLVAETDFET